MRANISFDGELIASGVDESWTDDEVRTCDIGGGNVGYFAEAHIAATADGFEFRYVDQSNTRPGRKADSANVVQARALEDVGNVQAGPFGCDVTAL